MYGTHLGNRIALAGRGALLCLLTLLAALPDPAAAAEGYLGVRLRGGAGHIARGGDRVFVFDSPPTVEDVDPAGPAGDLLRVGDVILKVNGRDITHRRSAAALQRFEAGDELRLVVERQGRRVNVPRFTIPAATGDEAYFVEHRVIDLRADASAGSRPAARAESAGDCTTVIATDSGGVGTPSHWLGMGFDIHGIAWKTDDDTRMHYEFTSPPDLYAVDPGGPADMAGLRRGDVLTHIDGVDLTTKRGGELFSTMEAGVPVVFTYTRDGERRQATLTPEASRGRSNVIDLRASARREQHLRYAGSLGDTDIEVRGVGIVEVRVDKGAGEVYIIADDLTVKLTRN